MQRSAAVRKFVVYVSLACCFLLFSGFTFAQTVDLIETNVTVVGGTLITAGTIQVSDTATNQGSGVAGSSTTRYFLNATAVRGGALLGSRPIPSLAAGASSVSSGVTLSVPTNVVGQYYVVACANDTNVLTESSTTNNCAASAIVTIGGADLVENAVSIAGGTLTAGGTMLVNDTATNQGGGSAAATVTRFYINTSASKTGGTLLGSRAVGPLAAGASSVSASLSLNLPLNLAGTNYLVACANDTSAIIETSTANNCSATPVLIGGADLVETGVAAVGGTLITGGTILISDTVTNQGTGNAGNSTTRFFLNTSASRGGWVLGTRLVVALAAGSSSVSPSLTFALPTATPGQYYVVACANDTNFVLESDSTNDCTASAVTVGGADLAESGVTVAAGTLTSGGAILVSDTVTNLGAGSAGATITRFYLNATATKGGVTLGSRAVGTLASGANSVSNNLSLTLPSNINGKYYVVACANDTLTILEGSTANNCAASTVLTIGGADLTITALGTNLAAAAAGATLAVSDTTANALAPAATTYTRYYLATTPNQPAGGYVLGGRQVPALTAGNSSSATATFSIPGNIVAGTYYLIACANDTHIVTESNTANNCAATPVVIYAAANTVYVDPSNAGAADVNCGTAATPCRTITEGIAAARAGQTVLVGSGTYTEQVSIRKNITLASLLRNAAVVQAPAVLVADPATGFKSLVAIGGGLTTPAVVNMAVRGPGLSSCNSISYGVLVQDANAIIAGNQVLSIRDSPYSSCNNGVAIAFGSRALSYTGHYGTIAYNTVMDYNLTGIVVDGDNNRVNVISNFVTGQDQPAYINAQNGIQMSRGAVGVVDSNTVLYNRFGVDLYSMGAAGILLYDVTGGLTVTNNTVTGNDEGIGVYGDPGSLVATTKVALMNNSVNSNAILGIHLSADTSANTIWANTAQSNGVYDAADEHPDLTSNDWGTSVASHNNVIGSGSIQTGSLY